MKCVAPDTIVLAQSLLAKSCGDKNFDSSSESRKLKIAHSEFLSFLLRFL